jgi:hypothetical protein
MRIAVIHFPVRNDGRLASIAGALAAALEKAGHRVEILDGKREANAKLLRFEYILIGTEPRGLNGQLPAALLPFLASSGPADGLRACAFVRRRGLFHAKTLASLMKAMEREGMRVNAFETLVDADAAGERVASLPLEARRT